MRKNTTEQKLGKAFTPTAALAFSLGTSIGWGSLVVTANTYLSQAGPMGSVIGMFIGGLIMLIIARNYHYMINCFPDAGGSYAFARDAFGYDYGFLTAWFLMLTYLAILWANATAVPLFARNFLGDIFRFGYMYTVFGYDVYAGEVCLTIAALSITVLLLSRYYHAPVIVMVIMAVLFTIGIVVCFGGAVIRHDRSYAPYFVPDSSSLSQLIKIAVISPWAFIGFENISHFSEEYTFSRKKSFRILTISIILTTLLYVFVMVLSVTAFPPQYNSWLEYIRDLKNLSGLEALPAFYAAQFYLGNFGVWTLIVALAALVISSLIGNIFALSRLLYSMGKDGILPSCFERLSDRGIPQCSLKLILVVSLVIPFLGRTAIGWIVDVTTLGATIIYAIVSAAAYKMAKEQKDPLEKWTGMTGLVIMFCFVLYLLLPNLISSGSMESASYFLFVVWSVLGFLFFRWILARDRQNRFGRSIIVWIGLLTLILFVSMVWLSQATMETTSKSLNSIEDFYVARGLTTEEEEIIPREMASIKRSLTNSIITVLVLFGTSLGVLLNNYRIMSRRAQESELQLAFMSNIANTDPLTGVKSKHAYAEQEQLLNREIMEGTAEPFALVVCDVNGLKFVNDNFGHKAGDALIKSASEIICEMFIHSPVYRTGGDEFVVYLSGRDYENRHYLMKSLHQLSVAHIDSDRVVISAGLSDFVEGKDKEIHSVFERADRFMYQEKESLKKMGAKTR
ncbi:MAG: amino acid permease [Anaerolineaceae bacterium]|nr:amino acid permease [Anaerolineaceae bacterium]